MVKSERDSEERLERRREESSEGRSARKRASAQAVSICRCKGLERSRRRDRARR